MIEPLVRVRDVAAAIRATLQGNKTKKELGDWAFGAMLRDDEGVIHYDPPLDRILRQILYALMMMSEGVDYELTDEELREMLARVEGLDPARDHS